MSNYTSIAGSIITSGSVIKGSQLTNSTSNESVRMTPEMWAAAIELANTFGKTGQKKDIEALKGCLDRGDRAKARAIWPRVESFLQNFANVSQILSALSLLVK